MKKIVLFISLVVLSVISYGQEVVQAQQVQSCIVRNGDRYTVDGMTYINSSEFRGYLIWNCDDADKFYIEFISS